VTDKPRSSEEVRRVPDNVVSKLMGELDSVFKLSTTIGDYVLEDLIEERLLSLSFEEAPEWGVSGALTQLAMKDAGPLDFYYRPHLFPGMDAALRLGHHLQFDLLPQSLPSRSPLRIAALLESYCHLSGDLLGWRLEDDELFLWIADVSGHGVRAGMAAATLYFLVNGVEPGNSPGEVARRANESMLSAKKPGRTSGLFATAFWLRASPGGEVCYSSSGHNPMLLVRSSGEVEYLEATGLPIGLMAGQSYGERTFRLGERDRVCLFTDGVVEAMSPTGEEFGERRVKDLLVARRETPIEHTRNIHRAVNEYRTNSLLDDDVTLMVVERAEVG
jgi:sigma-B regulation protein RsbU (phosphoserine phosphatase)